MSASTDDFEDELENYLNRVRQANSEATRGHEFLLFVRQTFDTIDSDHAPEMLPYLEEYVQTRRATVAISGRIDARLGNVIIEFKVDLESDIDDAKQQLRKYITAIWDNEGQDQKYYLVASNGIRNCVYVADIEEDAELAPANIELTEVDEFSLSDDDPDKVFTQLDRYLLYSEEIRPTAENFVRDFGPNSPVWQETLDVLEAEWESVQEEDVEVLYDEWKSYLEIVHGEDQTQSLELYLRHTYLSTLAKIMAYIQYSGGVLPDDEEIRNVITGKIFDRLGIQNFIEEDFFSWIARPAADGAEARVAEVILARLRDYRLTDIKEDVLKELYQNLVTQRERHNLGEYYTPDWLVEEIVQEELDTEPDSSVLDPSCGSGTFLFRSIHYKREHTDLEGQELLEHIEENVVGIDIHPLALIIARVNYLLALGDLLRDARQGSFTVPVYLSNSIQPPTYELTNETVEVYRFNSNEGVFDMPVGVTEGDDDLNEVLDGVRDYLKDHVDDLDDVSQDGFNSFLDAQDDLHYDSLSDLEKDTLFDSILSKIKNLKEDGRDTIWTFILKNVYKPIYLEDEAFDRVLGNPPWLPYRDISREDYSEHVRDLIINEYRILDSGDVENITHMELATAFYVYCADTYLNDDGRISFVMPRGLMNGDHLDRFRRADFTIDMKYEYLWDFRDVSPLFNNLTCVLAASTDDSTNYPIEGHTFEGTLESVNVSHGDALEQLSISDTPFYLNELGSRTVLMDEELNPELFDADSFYNDDIYQGATVVPRKLWFVDFVEDSRFGINPQEPLVESSERASRRAERGSDPWHQVEMNQQIEDEFLFHCVTGSEVIYFNTLDYPTAVLPLQIVGNNYNMLDEQGARSNGKQHLAQWLSDASEQYDQFETEVDDIYTRLNYHNGLEDQDPNARYRVLQNTSGSYVCGAVVDMEDLDDISLNGTTIELQRNNDGRIPLIVDHKCYHYETDDKDEAYYLSGFLNAPLVKELIEEMMSQGLFGGRDIHKKVWEIAIPEYDPDKDLHKEIRDKAIEGERRTEDMMDELLDGRNPDTALGHIRGDQRDALENLRSDLSELCLEALEASGTAQTTLDSN